jgi:hypothetical protein
VTNSLSKSYRGSVHSSLKAQRNQTNRNDSPGSELFPAAGSSYIPSGLTEKEWNEIKRKERKELEKKDFGAWGPRCAKSDRPEGDWMVMPSLWTRGFNSNNSIVNSAQKGNNYMWNRNVNGQSKASSTNSSSSNRWNMKRLLPVYAMTFVLLEWILASFYGLHKKDYVSLFVMAALKMKKTSIVMPATKFVLQGSIIVSKLFISAAFLQPIQALVAKFQDRFQWKFTSCLLFVTVATMIISLLLSTLATSLFGAGVGGLADFG